MRYREPGINLILRSKIERSSAVNPFIRPTQITKIAVINIAKTANFNVKKKIEGLGK